MWEVVAGGSKEEMPKITLIFITGLGYFYK